MAADKIRPARVTDLIRRPPIKYPSWIGPAILPKGGVCLFGGHSKIGKSFLALEVARALVTGTPLFGYSDFQTPEPANVLYVEREIGEHGLQKRASIVFADEDLVAVENRLWYISQDPDTMLDTMAGMNKLIEMIGDTRANVVILDPISHLHSGDENDNTQMTKVFNNIERLRQKFSSNGLSFVLAHHFRKPPEGRFADSHDDLSFHNFRGASKFFSAPDTICTAHRIEELVTDWEAWRLKIRWVCRHDESPADMYLTVNQYRDLRVRWERTAIQARPVATTNRQLRFSPATPRLQEDRQRTLQAE